jgi:uncharacterized protein YsxB (DUF464 family)
MIRVSIDGFTLTVKGHAGYAEAGKDIFCAAASTLATTLAQCVTNMHHQGWLRETPTVELVSGNTVISCKPKLSRRGKARRIYDTIMTGYELLSFNYPAYITMVTGTARE